MKKILALTFALVLCLGLCACGSTDRDSNPSDKKHDDTAVDTVAQEYVGTWKGSKYLGGGEDDVRNYKYATLLLKEDGTGTYTVTYGQDEPQIVELEWSYDQTNHTIDVSFPKQNSTGAFEIKEDDGKTYLQMGSLTAPLYRE